MRLHSWSPASRHGARVTNFGDELNAVLWPQLLGPAFLDDDDDVAFLGIGSLLGWPKTGDATRRCRVVFGTGAAFADAPRREPRDATWRIYCVRGPLTAQAYELDASLAIADPAILLARFHRRTRSEVRYGYMPHIAEATRWSHVLAGACEEMGVRYIDPRNDVASVIDAVGSVSVMYAEAMHGAIAADALRIPWVPVFSARRPHGFKWTDWCRSMHLDFEPRRLVNVASWSDRVGVRGRAPQRVAASTFVAQFHRLTSRCIPLLSADHVHAEKLEQLNVALDRLQTDFCKGSAN